MPEIEIHIHYCQMKLGKGFTKVHLWLDEFCGKEPWGTRHRHLRHHQEGIEEVRQKWGEHAARAAEFHIRQDLELEDWPSDDPIPANSDEYRKSGLW